MHLNDMKTINLRCYSIDGKPFSHSNHFNQFLFLCFHFSTEKSVKRKLIISENENNSMYNANKKNTVIT